MKYNCFQCDSDDHESVQIKSWKSLVNPSSFSDFLGRQVSKRLLA